MVLTQLTFWYQAYGQIRNITDTKSVCLVDKEKAFWQEEVEKVRINFSRLLLEQSIFCAKGVYLTVKIVLFLYLLMRYASPSVNYWKVLGFIFM